MTDLDLLKQKIDASGITPVAFAAAIGVSLPTYYKLKAGKSEFTASMIQKASVALTLTREERDAIFFAEKRE